VKTPGSRQNATRAAKFAMQVASGLQHALNVSPGVVAHVPRVGAEHEWRAAARHGHLRGNLPSWRTGPLQPAQAVTPPNCHGRQLNSTHRHLPTQKRKTFPGSVRQSVESRAAKPSADLRSRRVLALQAPRVRRPALAALMVSRFAGPVAGGAPCGWWRPYFLWSGGGSRPHTRYGRRPRKGDSSGCGFQLWGFQAERRLRRRDTLVSKRCFVSWV
jgi:hypothetical protein